MRKIFLSMLASVLTIAAIAQEVTTTTTTTSEAPVLRSKKGEAYLPIAGEWGLGVSANPFLDYLGNFVNGYDNFNDGPNFEFASNPANNIAVFGKLMKDANTAYRIRFNVGIRSTTNKAVISQNELNPDPAFPAFTEDWQKVNTTAIVIAPGIEKRRGSTRLQGVYGAELVLGFNNTKVSYDYGNAMSADFNAPITNDFDNYGYGENILTGNEAAAAVRVVEDKSGSNFLVGARGFIGVEYFFAPKISIGGEFGYMLGFQTQRKATITAETWDASSVGTREVKVDEFRNGGVTSLGIGLDNLSGSINLLFYF
jgi:hypothetical protein